MGKNKEKKALRRASKNAAASSSVPSQTDETLSSVATSDGPTLTFTGPTMPNLYEAKLNMDGGISLGTAPTGKAPKSGRGGHSEEAVQKQTDPAGLKGFIDPTELENEEESKRAKKRRKNR